MNKFILPLIAMLAASSAVASAPGKYASRVPDIEPVTFYEGFEDYDTSMGLNWIPEGWSKVCTDAHKPTPEMLARNVNNTWYVYESSEFMQEMTPDGWNEAFIHFGFTDDERGSSNAAQDEWLITPEISLGANEELSFYLQCDYSTVYEWDWNKSCFKDRSDIKNTLKIMVTTDGGDSWEEAWDLEADEVRRHPDAVCFNQYGNLQYHQFTTSLAAFAGKSVRIGFRYVRQSGDGIGNSMMLDGVTVKPAKAVEGPNREGWTLLGTGSMADGWVLPALTVTPSEFYNPQDYIFPVDIYEKDGQPGMFLLASPWTSDKFPFIHLNGNTTVTYDIVVDATDPDFVIITPQVSGFEHKNPGQKANRYATPYYISHAGKQYLDEGYSKPDIIAYGHAATYDAKTGIINIPGPKYGHTASDVAYIPSGFNEAYYPSVIYLPTGNTPELVWNPLGKASFTDGFLFPGFVGDPAGNEWEVEIEERAGQPGMYRIIDPYTSAASPMAMYNNNVHSAKIIIDATDPELVIMEPQYSGFSGMNNGTYWNYYIGNDAGVLAFSGGYLKDQIKQMLAEERQDKLADGVITFREPMFGSNNYGGFGYKWSDENDQTLNHPARLVLPSAASVGSATAAPDAPESWYTISGVRLGAEPSAPGLYIRVKGSLAEKILK